MSSLHGRGESRKPQKIRTHIVDSNVIPLFKLDTQGRERVRKFRSTLRMVSSPSPTHQHFGFCPTSFMDGPKVHFPLECTLWFHIQKPWKNSSYDGKIAKLKDKAKSMNRHFSRLAPNEKEEEKWRDKKKRQLNMVWQSSTKIKNFPKKFPNEILKEFSKLIFFFYGVSLIAT